MPYSSNVIKHKYNAENNVFKYLLASDLHIGSKAHDAKLLDKEFSNAVEEDAQILIFGDLMEMIMNGDRKRYNPASDQYGSDTYVNDTIEDTVNRLLPYVNNIHQIGTGNHESVITKYHNIDVVSIIIYQLNAARDKALPPIVYTHYSGFTKMQYEHTSGGARTSQTMFHTHGNGGGAEVTKGMINMNRLMARADADVYVHGHLHTKFLLPDERKLYITPSGEVSSRRVMGVQLGAYVKIGGTAGDKYVVDFGIERMRGNQATGGVMMVHTVTTDGIDTKFIV